MDKVVKSIAFIFLIGNSFQLKAQNLVLKTVEDAINYSLEKNPDLEVYKLNIEKSQQEYKIQKRSAMPKITGVIDYQNNIELPTSVLPGELVGQPGETVSTQFGTQYSWNAGLNMTKDMLNFERKMQVKISKLNIEMESAKQEVFTQLLKEQTTMYYYGALVVKHALSNNQENLESSDNILKVTQQKFNQGLVDLPSLNKAKITVNNIRQTINTNESAYDNYVFQLKNILSVKLSETVIFSEKIDIESNLLASILEVNEDKNLHIFNLQKEESELDIKLKKSVFLPKLTATKYFGYQQFYDDGGLSFSSDSWSKNINFGMNLSIPIFNGFKNSKKLKIAKINNKINEQTMQYEKEKSKNADVLLLNDYQKGLSQLELTKDNYRLYKKNVELSLQKYDNGVISLDSHLNTYEDYLKAESNYLNSLSAVYTNYSTILSRK